jgi:hypothetical protein
MKLAGGSELRFLDEPEGRFISIDDLINGVKQADKITGKSNTWTHKVIEGLIDAFVAIRDVK